MKRYLEKSIFGDLDEKIVLISGPRQVGKTHLSKSLGTEVGRSLYLNFDSVKHRKIIRDQDWDRSLDLIIFDELHKMKSWKRWLKGVYDVDGIPPGLLVTGSARMDTFRRGGDSLAGRHFLYRLHPLSVREVCNEYPSDAISRMLECGAFPEPFIRGDRSYARRWRRSHLDRILRQDLLDFANVRDLKSMEVLVDLLAERVGSPVSFSNLAADLEVSPHTVKRWIQLLEALFIVFIVTPYSKKIAKSILKEPKIYFYDVGRVQGSAARLENLVANHLLKEIHFWEDTQGESGQLHYLRNKEKKEVDFLVLRGGNIRWMVEVKETDSNLSPSLFLFSKRLGLNTEGIVYQVVGQLGRSRQVEHIKSVEIGAWLKLLDC